MCLPLGKKASAMHGLKIAMKQPTYVSFDFKRSSNDQDSRCACAPKTKTFNPHFNETTD